MENRILKQLILRLRVEYFVMWGLAALVLVLNEIGFLEQGIAIQDEQTEYVLQSACILLTLILIPLSLKLFSVSVSGRVSQLPEEQALTSYIRWSEIRLALLAVVVLFGLSVYYATLNSIGGFCALVGLLASFFCFPNKKRIKEELGL